MGKKENSVKINKFLKDYDKHVAASDTNEDVLLKSFRNRLDKIEPSILENIKDKLNSTTAVLGSSLFITGFLIARLTIPVSTVSFKGIENQSYLENQPTQIIEINSEKQFEKIVNFAVAKNIALEFQSYNGRKQLFIKLLEKNKNIEFKNLLGLSNEYTGPITIITN